MSLLLLVRHGQASFLTDDYDRLSPLGEQQARLLGEFWRDRGLPLDAVYSGGLKRQIDTAEIVRSVYLDAGLPAPERTLLTGLDEYRAEEFLFHHLAELCERDDDLAALYRTFKESNEEKDRYRAYQKMFETAMGYWLRGEIGDSEVESWMDFVSRVRGAIRQMTDRAGSGEHVAAFTSGGPIGVAMHHALETTPEATLQLSWMVRNSSVSTFLFTRDRFTLSSFNELPHLPDRRDWSYR